MRTKLDHLLSVIDPSHTLDEVAARVDNAINSFHTESAQIECRDEFQSCLAEFHCHVLNHILQLRSHRAVDRDMDWGLCAKILVQEHGPSGLKAGFELARTGRMYEVLKSIARRMDEEYAGREISARVLDYWNNLSVDEQLAASQEYLEKFGHLLPPELTEGSAGRIRANFPKVLEQHPRLLSRMRQIGRSA